MTKTENEKTTAPVAGTKSDGTTMNLDFEVTSAKPAWLTVTLPNGDKWRISVATMIDAVRAKLVNGETSFDLDLRWQAKWEKI